MRAAPRPHCSGLHSFVTLLLLELHDRADGQLIEWNPVNAIAMKVDVVTVVSGDSSEAFLDLVDSAEYRKAMPLDVAAVLAGVILQKAPRAVEGISKSDVYVRVSAMLGAFTAHDDFIAGHGDVDLHIERRALVAMCRRSFDDDVAAGNAVREPLQPLDVLSDTSFDGGR